MDAALTAIGEEAWGDVAAVDADGGFAPVTVRERGTPGADLILCAEIVAYQIGSEA